MEMLGKIRRMYLRDKLSLEAWIALLGRRWKTMSKDGLSVPS